MDKIYNLLMVQERERSQLNHFLIVSLLLGVGLALGRGSMDALFLKRYGIEYLPVMYGVLGVVLAVTSLAYAAYADHLSPERFFRILFGVLAIALIINWGMIGLLDVGLAYPLYFLVYETASELLLLHAALYFSQNFDTMQAKRLTPLIFSAIQVGTIVGGLLLLGLSHRIGVQNVMIVWSALLLGTSVLISRHHERVGLSLYFQPVRQRRTGLRQPMEQIMQGLRFARGSSLLLAASMALFFMVIAFYILSFSINRIYATTFSSEEALSAFFGILTAVTSALTLLIQVLVTGRLLKRYGLQRANLIFPTSGILAYGFLLASFALPAALFGSFVRDVLLPAVRRPTRNLFFNALPDYMQGRTRALAVALVLPAALMSASGILIATQHVGHPAWFLAPGMLAGFAYLYYAIRMNRAYLTAMLTTLKERVLIPGRYLQNLRREGGSELVAELIRGVEQDDDELAVAYARLLVENHPECAAAPIVDRLSRSSVATRDRLLRLLAYRPDDHLTAVCHKLLDSGDNHLNATIAEILFREHDPRARERIPDFLRSSNPRLAASGIHGVYQYCISEKKYDATTCWRTLLIAPDANSNIAGLHLFTSVQNQELLPEVLSMLDHASTRVRKVALRILSCWPFTLPQEIISKLAHLCNDIDPEVRELCVRCFRLLPAEQVDAMVVEALEDGHPRVRDAAIDALDDGTTQFNELLTALILGNAGSPRAQKSMLLRLIRIGAKPGTFVAIAEAKAADAELLSDVYNALVHASPHSNEIALLTTVLLERKEQVIDLSLVAMERVTDADTIQIIRAGLRSRDSRQVATACEALRNVQGSTLVESLSRLVEQVDVPRPALHASAAGFRNVKSLMDWCRNRPDPWLRQCVKFADTLINSRGGLVGTH